MAVSYKKRSPDKWLPGLPHFLHFQAALPLIEISRVRVSVIFVICCVNQIAHAFQADRKCRGIMKQRRCGGLDDSSHSQQNQTGIDEHPFSPI